MIFFFHKRKIYYFDPNVFLAIATNISVQLKTDFVVQGHIYEFSTRHKLVKIKKLL